MTIPKFRAWHKEKKIMAAVDRIAFEAKWVQVFKPVLFEGVSCWALDTWSFDEIELMQCIGKDLEGNDLFEGDILNFFGGHIMQGWENLYRADGEIMGNCFEHPELLEKV